VSTKVLLIIVAVVIILAAGGLYFYTKPKDLSPNVSAIPSENKKEIKPSETFIEYTDPAGFSFNYPDNLSIEKNEEMDSSTYADLQLFSKDVSGSLSLRIVDTKLKKLEDWAKEASGSSAPLEKQLGNLKALEVRTSDRLMLAAIDQGVLFNIEVPLLEQDFWTKVYEKVLADFTFIQPEAGQSATVSNASSEDIVFESEEVVE
jgi:hypothetical protein